MRQACRLGEVLIVELKGWRDRWIEDLDFAAQNLDFARGKVRIGRARRTLAHKACDANTKLVTQALGRGKTRGIVRIKHDLGQTRTVAQIDKNHATMIAATMHPTKKGDCLTKVVTTNLTGVAGTHANSKRSYKKI